MVVMMMMMMDSRENDLDKGKNQLWNSRCKWQHTSLCDARRGERDKAFGLAGAKRWPE
jgi:hypothetical protein